MLTCQLTKKIIKSTITTCTTLRNNDVSLTSSKMVTVIVSSRIVPCTSGSSYHGVPGKRNATVHFAATVAPNSPDLNLVDYSVWSILQEKVYKTSITDLDDLKHRISTECDKLNHAVIAAVRVSGVDIFQLVWRLVVVISSIALNFDIRTVVGWYSSLIFLQLSVMMLCILIHDDRLIHKVK